MYALESICPKMVTFYYITFLNYVTKQSFFYYYKVSCMLIFMCMNETDLRAHSPVLKHEHFLESSKSVCNINCFGFSN